MYIIFGEDIVDSEEIKQIIEENSDFTVDRDMCKGTKREDVVAYQLSIPVEILNKELEQDYNLDEIEEDDFKTTHQFKNINSLDKKPLYSTITKITDNKEEVIPDYTYEYFKEILIDDITFPYIFQMTKYWTDEYINWITQDRAKEFRENTWITVCNGVVSGRVIGGNLNTIGGIWGSKYMPEIKNGDILFIEDSLKDISTIERSFSLLKINGVFDKISGIILGKHELFDDLKTGKKPYEVLLEVLGDKKIPFIADFDCCHTHPMFTLPIGCKIELNATEKKISIIG